MRNDVSRKNIRIKNKDFVTWERNIIFNMDLIDLKFRETKSQHFYWNKPKSFCYPQTKAKNTKYKDNILEWTTSDKNHNSLISNHF